MPKKCKFTRFEMNIRADLHVFLIYKYQWKDK